jgi:transcription antitermination factor NusG
MAEESETIPPGPDPYPGGYLPGDEVEVVDGPFTGLRGVIATEAEARGVTEGHGLDAGDYRPPEGETWVVVSVFGRPVAVLLDPGQLRWQS